MARDVHAIPISTVTSEATFSARGRVIDPYRPTLAPEMKEEVPDEVLLPEIMMEGIRKKIERIQKKIYWIKKKIYRGSRRRKTKLKGRNWECDNIDREKG
ncbi:hypothetical protein OSB04_006689 [Centaurea solstitialis]|uniref:HAT C-terminal dimerisation domain-containing protein n=1 Tax=Centaurea solstitialis TaxID=347529 RepID=A0AA38WS56_9ASTR|nr:hypothetical protein OSB04_006689 [Centaurea solstitialis]